MNEIDMMVSRRLQKIMRKLDELVTKEVGESMGLGMVIFPFANEKSGLKPGDISRFQYISNCPRSHMHGCFKALLEKWESGQHQDIPPHQEN